MKGVATVWQNPLVPDVLYRKVNNMKAKRARRLPMALAVIAALSASPAAAQGALDANYQLSIAGLPVGTGAWKIDFADDSYAMAVSGKVSGLLQAISTGDGTAAIRGGIAGSRLSPQSYMLNVRTRKKADVVQMALANGAVRQVAIEPPPEPKAGVVPLTEAHKRGVIDPISAAVVPRGNGDGASPDACQRTIPVFDGRQRYDLTMSYKRTEKVRTAGFEGNAVVCRVLYNPIGGYEPQKSGTKFLKETKDIEMAFVPVPGTRFLAMYRIQIPTFFGVAVLEPTRFQVNAKTARPVGQ